MVTCSQRVLSQSVGDCSIAAETISSPRGFKVTIKAMTIVTHGHRRMFEPTYASIPAGASM